jgi:hypothetical protein
MKFRRAARIAVSSALCILLLAPLAQAGPPLICWPFDIGDAKSLPFGRGNFRTIDAKYDTSRLVDDTLALLNSQTPVLVRMETMRRAAVYAEDKPVLAQELASKLLVRAKKDAGALALFDAGYFLETYRQFGYKSRPKLMAAAGDGYSKVVEALRLRGGDAEMEFAAALVALEHNRVAGREHLQRALAAASPRSALERNLVSHAQIFGLSGATAGELRAGLNKN